MGAEYVARILRVDLDKEKVSVEELGELDVRKYLGGCGLGARILWDETTATTDAFSPENRLMFMIGPLTGNVPQSSRYTVCGISPANGAWGEAHAGGTWGAELSRTGFSGIVFQGKARRPVYLYIDNEEVDIRDARHLWGKDAYEVSDLVRHETDNKAYVAAIGRAGENLVRMAGIINDGRLGRAAARCGMGAVMGSKNLKAVAVRGSRKPLVLDEAGLKATNQETTNRLTRIKRGEFSPVPKLKDVMLGAYYKERDVSIRNHSKGRFDSWFEKFDSSWEEGEPQYCHGCPISCLESHLYQGRRQVVGQALAPMGSNCLIDDFEALQEAYDLCNMYGMDTQSVGFCIAFAMECFEEGLITKEDIEGIDLTWGNAKAMLEMVRQMGEAQGFGKILGQGVKRAAEHIGGKAHLYAMHVKGLEPAEQDPRTNSGLFIGYATSNCGAAHMESLNVNLAGRSYLEKSFGFDGAELGYPPPIPRLGLDGKAGQIARVQDLGAISNSLTVCYYSSGMYGTSVATYLRCLNCVTGYDISFDELMQAGERIFNLKRLINLRHGLTAKDDTLPSRYFSRRTDVDDSLEYIPSEAAFKKAIQEYYSVRGWTEEGIPTGEKLLELGLPLDITR
ncbi:aldehyde ferredoxin oxidoreductase family protein [Chloroflexota bacterium]